MSLLPIIMGAARTGLAAKAPSMVGKLFGRKGRKRARAAAARPSLLETGVSLLTPVARARGMREPGMMPRRRRRGISGTEIRGFKKVSRLLAQFGMRPRGLARPMGRRRSLFSARRTGDFLEE